MMQHAMHRTLLPTLVLLALALPSLAQDFSSDAATKAKKAAPKAMSTITAEDLSRHLHAIAGPEFEGRLTGTPGQIKASEYIKAHFEKLGLAPAGEPGEDGKPTYFQHYPISMLELTEEAGLHGKDGPVHTEGGWILARTRRGAAPKDVTIEGSLCLLHGMSELPDLSGRIPVMAVRLAEDPEGGRHINETMQIGMARQAALFRRCSRMARDGGAPAVVVVVDPHEPPLPLAPELHRAVAGEAPRPPRRGVRARPAW